MQKGEIKSKGFTLEGDETLYLLSIPGMKEKIIDGLKTPIEECVSEDEVDWQQSDPSGESKR